MQISVIIPVLNEVECIRTTLRCLQPLRARGHEVILVDGGSTDETCTLAAPLVDHIVHSAAGRARQMNAGAAAARGKLLWFVHADTRVPASADREILEACCRGSANEYWGYFRVQLSGQQFLLRIVERMMNLRSHLTSVATGDQGLFMSSGLYLRAGGFPELPLMEDVALSKRLRRVQMPLCLQDTLLTSSRRWEQHGIVRTVVLMWALRLAWFAGVPPKRLARHYAF